MSPLPPATSTDLQRLARATAIVLFCCGAAAAGAQNLVVSAVLVSKAKCTFDQAGLTLDFGALNPTSTAAGTASVVGRVSCNGGKGDTVLALSLNSGSYSTAPGARRMRHETDVTEFLAYSLSISPASATIPKNSGLNFTVNGSILASQFQNALAGNYLDTVRITVAP
jgi:spore coat protein U-like protein